MTDDPDYVIARKGAGSAIIKIRDMAGRVLWEADEAERARAMQILTGRRS